MIDLRARYPELGDGDLSAVSVDFSEEQRWLTYARGRVTVALNLGELDARIATSDGRIELASAEGIRFDDGALVLPPDSVGVVTRD